MGQQFTLLDDGRFGAPALDVADIGGEDISLEGGDMTVSANGDLATVIGQAAARQSVLRELPANPGSFARRPQWGGGLRGLIFKGDSRATRERAVARARARLFANPRIKKVNDVSSDTADTGVGMRLRIDVTTPNGHLAINPVIKPPGVR